MSEVVFGPTPPRAKAEVVSRPHSSGDFGGSRGLTRATRAAELMSFVITEATRAAELMSFVVAGTTRGQELVSFVIIRSPAYELREHLV